jgi:uncharacterized protein YjbJ (UPF0337 family)
MKQSVMTRVVEVELINEGKTMNRDQIKGAAKDVKGDIKKGIGEATGDKALVDEGNLDKAEGKIQKGAGDLKSKL